MKMLAGSVLVLVTVFTGQSLQQQQQAGDTDGISGQRFTEEPRSVSVLEGQSVQLACSVDTKQGVLQWTKDDFGLGTSRDLSEYSRYRMVGDEARGEWNLVIVNATVEDDAKYQCQVGATETAAPIRSRYALVRVMSPPQPPVMTAGPELTLRQGKVALVQCISKGGKPASVIAWRRDGRLINEGVQEKVELLTESSRFMTVSTLTFPITANMSGAVLECEASHEAEQVSRTVSTKLSVEYKPVVSLEVDRLHIYEGDSVKLSCAAAAVPELVEYSWRLGEEEIKEGRGAREVVIVVDRNFNKKRVSCFARNTIGESVASYTLDVKYSPVFKVVPEDVTGDLGAAVRLECRADSNPPASYTWRLGEDRVGTGPVLSLQLTNATAGLFTCEAAVPGFPAITQAARLRLRGPPRILLDHGTQFSSVGETVHVICEAESVPAAKTFSWTFNGSPLGSSSSGGHSIIETQHGASVRSTVIISQAEQGHFGEYRCSVENDIGTSHSTVTLVEKESMPLLIIISAAIGGFLIAIVAIVIAMTWWKITKRKAADPASSWPKTSHQITPDRVSTSSQESNLQSSNTTSSMSTVDELEEEFRSNSDNSLKPRSYSHSHSNYNSNSQSNYSDYRQFRSEQDLLDHAAKYSPDYHNPYLQTITPTSDYTSSGHMSPSYHNFAPVSMSSRASTRADTSAAAAAYILPDTEVARLSSERERETRLLARLQLQPPHSALSEPLNQSAIGTHV